MKSLLTKLIGAETTAQKGELAAARIVAEEFSLSGIDSEIATWDRTRANVVAHMKSTGQKSALLFACHLDVVPAGKAEWKQAAFSGAEIDGRIFGRGAADMKGPTSAVITAIRRVADSGIKLQGDIIFLGAAGEETDSCGAQKFVREYGRGTDLAGVVIPEPTDFEIVTAHRGVLWLKVATKGKAAHGSTPQLGVNAISAMKAVLDELENHKIQFKGHELLEGCSMSVNTITAGEATNMVPDECSITIDIRTLPDQNHEQLTGEFREILSRLKQRRHQFEAEIRILRDVGALETDANSNFVCDFCSCVGVNETTAVGFTTDAPYLAELGAPVVIFGPGKPDVVHRPDEYIDIADMEKAVEYYKNIIVTFLA